VNALKKYGLSPTDYEAMLQLQGGVCAICKSASKRRRLDVDHDHQTGKVRGLLCEMCNKAIGGLGDSVERVESALMYLKKHKA
jgi:hypothetical protein